MSRNACVKKSLCVVFAIMVIISVLCVPVSAAEINSEVLILENIEDRTPLNNVITTIQEANPGAIITVEDEVISVVVTNNGDRTTNFSNSVRSGSIYAPGGGTWDNFIPPLVYQLDQNLTRPYGIVFLPANLTQILVDAKEDEIIKTIIDDGYRDEIGVTAIQEALLDASGNYYTETQIAFLAFDVSVGLFRVLNYSSLKRARDASANNKVRIEYCSSGGWPINYYYAWEGNYVDCTPWEDFEPRFRAGYFNVGYGIS